MNGDRYLDLIEAIERGTLIGDGALPRPRSWLRREYLIELNTWPRMRADLLGQIVADAGSIRRAVPVLGVPRSTLGSWLARDRDRR